MSKSKFRGEQGHWITKRLFFEETKTDERNYAIFTLKDDDHTVDGVVYKSLKKLYLSYNDITEYEFATNELGGWKHWKLLQASTFLKDHVAEWREELEVRLRSSAVKAILGMDSYHAKKYISDRGWEGVIGKGRPSKAAVEKETKQQAKIKVAVMEDYERLRK